MTITKYQDAIKRFEGFSPVARWDYAQHTNGYGTKAAFPGERISREVAEARFRHELAEAREVVERHAAHLDQGTKAALVSLTFNAGDKWTRSGLGDAIRENDIERAKALFLTYNKAGGEVLPGLVKRRFEELTWFGSDVASVRSNDQLPDVSKVVHNAASLPLTAAVEHDVNGSVSLHEGMPAVVSSTIESSTHELLPVSLERWLGLRSWAELIEIVLAGARPLSDAEASKGDDIT